MLSEVLELEISERQNFLDKLNISAEIRAEVESLLGFETEAESAMNFSAVEFSKDFFDEDSEKISFIG